MRVLPPAKLMQEKNIVVAVCQDGKLTDHPAFLRQEIEQLKKLGDLQGKEGELLVTYPKNSGVQRLFIYGLGKQKKVTLETLDKASGRIMKKAKALRLKEITFAINSFVCNTLKESDVIAAVALMSELAQYRYNELKTKSKQTEDAREIKIGIASNFKQAAPLVRQSGLIAQAITLTRTLADRPANRVYPQVLAQEARKLAKLSSRLKVKVLEKPELIKRGFGALLSVGNGSQRPPVLIELNYKGGKTGVDPIALVGKGITFDSGGISLKPSAKMDEMRYDMSGAAAVLGIIKAAVLLKLPVNIVGVIASAENMPSGSASRPGDIVKSLSGKTIEILNTDAEGRLVLADGITYAKKYNPTCIIDFATLTGAVIVALGHVATGMVSNNQKLAEAIKGASEASREKVWQLPLWDEYRDLVKSDNADVANIGNKPGAGTIVGAAFIEKFIGQTPWVHLDIAGTAWGTGTSVFGKGATGVGVRLILEWLKQR